eukprot:jgi/Chlat1/4494/Chrsp29S04428
MLHIYKDDKVVHSSIAQQLLVLGDNLKEFAVEVHPSNFEKCVDMIVQVVRKSDGKMACLLNTIVRDGGHTCEWDDDRSTDYEHEVIVKGPVVPVDDGVAFMEENFCLTLDEEDQLLNRMNYYVVSFHVQESVENDRGVTEMTPGQLNKLLYLNMLLAWTTDDDVQYATLPR